MNRYRLIKISFKFLFRLHVLAFMLPAIIFSETKSDSLLSNKNTVSFSHSFGQYYLIPSLASCSDFNLQYDKKKYYTDIRVLFESKITERVTYYGEGQMTNLPQTLIGTKYSRPDYLLTTGRFQESNISYNSKIFKIKFGRANFLEIGPRPIIIYPPVSGDGIAWTYDQENWQFEHFIANLPAEKSAGIVFRRIINYHHISFHYGKFNFGVGEYFILTGPTIGIDLKRMNPFIPYSRNSHDSYRDMYSGFVGDSDNSIIKVFLKWKNDQCKINLKLYIDEFQVDALDRKILNDAILFNAFVKKDYQYFVGKQMPWSIEGTISLASPNFGEHPGPFTTVTSASFPLFEDSPGMINLYTLVANIYPRENNRFSVAWHEEHWVNISSIVPEYRNLRTNLDSLKLHRDSRLLLALSHQIKSMGTAIALEGWCVSGTENITGGKISICYTYLN